MASGLIHFVTVMLRPEPRVVRVSGLAPFEPGAILLSASLQGRGVLAGEMTVLDPVALSAALVGAGELLATLNIGEVVSLSASLAARATLVAPMTVSVSLDASLVGRGAVTAEMTQTVALAAAFTGAGTLSATLAQGTGLSASFTGAGILAASMSQSIALAAALTGAGSLVAVMRWDIALASSMTGRGVVTSTMTVSAAANEDTDAAAYLNAQTTAPSSTERSLVDALVKGLKADGIWTKLDRLSLLAAETAQAARLCLRNPAKSMAATNLMASSFTANRGYTGDIAATGFLDFGEPFVNGASMFQQDSASVFVWCNNSVSPVVSTGTGRVPQVGNTGSARVSINVLGAAGNNTWQVNVSVATAYAGSGNRSGFRCAVRPSATNQQVYTGGQLVSDIASTSSTPSTTNGCSHRTAATYGDDRLAIIGYGAALTATDVANLNTRLNTYLTAKGAA
ncbi:MAG: hypothetical protein ACAH20_16935 [Methylobacteriaceae bacterium]